MATDVMDVISALDLADTIIKDYRGAVAPVLVLLAGITDSRGDPRVAALRRVVLKRLYCETDDCDSHFKEFIGDAQDEVNQTSSSTS